MKIDAKQAELIQSFWEISGDRTRLSLRPWPIPTSFAGATGRLTITLCRNRLS